MNSCVSEYCADYRAEQANRSRNLRGILNYEQIFLTANRRATRPHRLFATSFAKLSKERLRLEDLLNLLF